MKKVIFSLLMLNICASYANVYIHGNDYDHHTNNIQQQQMMFDTNSTNFTYILKQRFVNARGDNCRSYIVKGKANKYNHGNYTICTSR